jgi:hypothetical protein
VRVPEHLISQQFEVLAKLRVGVETGARVVKVGVAAGVEAGEVATPQLVECGGRRVAWVRAQKGRPRWLRWALS